MPHEFPLLCSAPVVRNILSGTQTQDRRHAWRPDGKPSPWQRVASGDRLWVRENFNFKSFCETETYQAQYWQDRELGPLFDWVDAPTFCSRFCGGDMMAFPSIHMPRVISRLTLVVTATKVERLADISEEDARAEGMAFRDHGLNRYRQQNNGWHADPSEAARGAHYCLGSARHAFGNLWEKLYGPSSWYTNPEVVAITFRVVKANIDSPEAKAA